MHICLTVECITSGLHWSIFLIRSHPPGPPPPPPLPMQQPAQLWYANYWATLTHKQHPPHPAQPRHTNHWAPRMRKPHQQEHQPQWPTESSNLMQHAKGRTGDCLRLTASVPRGFKLEKFRPAFGGDHRGTQGGEEVSQPNLPPLPMFEADSPNFASAPSAPRGFKLKKFWPAFAFIGGPPPLPF